RAYILDFALVVFTAAITYPPLYPCDARCTGTHPTPERSTIPGRVGASARRRPDARSRLVVGRRDQWPRGLRTHVGATRRRPSVGASDRALLGRRARHDRGSARWIERDHGTRHVLRHGADPTPTAARHRSAVPRVELGAALRS